MKTYCKRIFLTLLILYISLSFNLTLVKAETHKYLRIVNDNTILYADEDLIEPIFTLPKTYFLKVEEELQGYIKVSYGDQSKNCPIIYGYVKKEEVKPVDYQPQTPFL